MTTPMTSYERAWLAGRRLLPAHLNRVHEDLRRLVSQHGRRLALLDVGGRKSPYSISLDADVVITELPQESDQQRDLNLGVTDRLIEELRPRRSNIHRVILQDMTRSTIEDASFDGVISIEVIEHVREDEEFVRQIYRVIKPGGFLYLTTPNGDYCKNEGDNYNPDHVRHYTKAGLQCLLERHFAKVDVSYGIKTGKWRYRGLTSPSIHRPVRSAVAAVSNMVSAWESRDLNQPMRTAHLFGLASKADC